MIPRTEIIPDDFYNGYIALVKENDFREAIRKNTKEFRKLLENIPRKQYDHAYAEGKWTIREMLQHIIDAERVFAFRAVHLSRKDATPLPAFDENHWSANDGGATRKWKDLLEEFKAVRTATEYLYDAMTDDQLRFVGTVRSKPLNAFTIGYLIAGHVTHHMKVLEERYL
jgi:hypothetical protein